MATTALVVEILVAGLLAATWLIGLPMALLFPEETSRFLSGVQGLPGYSLLVSFMVLAVAYPLGWLLNAISYALAVGLYRRSLQIEVFGVGCTSATYDKLKTIVVMDEKCEEIVHRLNADTAVHRIARAGGINFFAFGLLVLALVDGEAGVACGAGLLALSLSFWLMAIGRHRRFYARLKAAASQIPEGAVILKTTGEGAKSWPDQISARLFAGLRSLRAFLLDNGDQCNLSDADEHD